MEYLARIIFLSIISFYTIPVNSQNISSTNKGIITGILVDTISQVPIQFVNIVLLNAADSSMVSGIVSNEKGEFVFNKLNYGSYYLKTSLLGYNNMTTQSITISNEKPTGNFGKIILKQSTVTLKEAVIVSKYSNIDFKLDRKVLNVGNDITSAGGTAVDAIKKLPSVEVDYQGNVSIRGKTNYKVLINDLPTNSPAEDVLKEIPVSMIDKIELITNPSSKYDADGTGAIINIITIKNKLNGLSAKIEGNINTNGSKSGSTRFGYKKGKINILASTTQSRNIWKYYDQYYTTSFDNEKITNESKSIGYNKNDGKRRIYNFGIDYEPNNKNFISVSTMLNDENRDMVMNNNYGTNNYLLNQSSFFQSEVGRGWYGPSNRYNAFYEHTFGKENHKLSLNIFYNYKHQKQTNTLYNFTTDSTWENNKTQSNYYVRENNVHNDMVQADLNYKLPLNEKTKLEAGYSYYINPDNAECNTQTDLPKSNILLFSTNNTFHSKFKAQKHSVFVTLDQEIGKFSYKIGCRFESFDRKVWDDFTNFQNNRTYNNLFPAIHVSYKLTNSQQIAGSYSKRIYYPVSWQLIPFPTYQNSHYAWTGYPGLNPENDNAFELSYLKDFNKSNFSFEIFHNRATESIGTANITDSLGLRIGYNKNMNRDYSTGVGAYYNFKYFDWIRLQQGINYYYRDLIMNIDNASVETSSYTYNITSQVTLYISKIATLNMNIYYYAPSVIVQGRSKGRLSTDFSISKELFNKHAQLAINIWDPFRLNKSDVTRNGSNFSDRDYYYNNSTNINIYFSYQINNYQKNANKHRAAGRDSESTNPQF